MRVHLGGPVIAAILLLAAGSAHSDTLTVTNTSDHAVGVCDATDCTLREAITAAQPGDVIQFAPSVTGTITLTLGQLSIDRNLTITGPGARVLAVSGNSASRVFLIVRNITAAISGLTIRDGSASPHPNDSPTSTVRMGGGIFNDGNLTLVACRITGNTAVSGATFGDQVSGAGIVNYIASTLTMRDCELSHNVARCRDAFGGGLYNIGTATLTNCTVSSNQIEVLSSQTTTGRGAGIRNARSGSFGGPNPYNIYGAATLNLINCTITNNSFVAGPAGLQRIGGGIQKSFDAPTNLRNTIVAGNNATDRPDVATEGTTAFNSQGHNLIGITDGSSGWVANDLIGTAADPRPAGLATTTPANNGGPTDTHALLSSSQARDAGDDAVLAAPFGLTTDQRGYPRLIGSHVDIGAFEFDIAQAAPNFFVTTRDEHNDGVCGIGDCSFLEALNASNANAGNNSVIQFIPAAYGTITNSIAGGLNIIRPVSIAGPGADLLTLSGAGANRLLNITSFGAIAISDVTIRDARSTTGDGGALRYNGSGTLTINACKFFNNTTSTTWSGGAIWTLGRVTITGSEFGGNKGGGGGAVYPRFGSVVTIDGCNFHDNEALNPSGGGLGGALLLWDGPTVGISNSVFINNKAARFGGAIHVLFNSTLNVSNTTFNGNSLSANSGEGGAVNNAGTMDVRDVTFTGNAVMGGGLGGAIRNSGTATLTGVTLSANRVDSGGWGAGINNSATCTLTNVTLSGNMAPGVAAQYQGFGGGIYSSAGSLTLTNVTLSGNLSGTGITGGGGGIHVTGGSVSLTNTALDNGPSGENCLGFTGGAACLSDDGTCGFGNGRDNVDLRLGALANNGGATATHLPLLNPQSPAIDGGTNVGAPTKDQRGIDRPQGGGFDVGAVEFAPSDIPPPPPTPTPTPTPTAVPARLGNISTRLRVETGDNVLIGGFIVTGTQPKKVIIRAIGTSLPFADKLADPILELHGPNGLIESNDNWIDSPNKQAILDSTIPPASDLESAIVQSLPANNAGYTAIVRGVNDGTGIGVVEAYDLDGTVDSDLANISTRGFVQTGDNVLIAGTIVVGQASQRVIIRAIGPSLPIPGAMANPTLELRDSSGTLLQENDNWVDSTDKQAIIDTTIPPTNDLESAIVATLPANNASYTAIVRGVNDTTGIAVVEVYALN